MNTNNLLKTTKGACFLLVAILAIPVTVVNVRAAFDSPANSSPSRPESTKVVGKITQKTNNAIAVSGQMITVTASTAYSKSGTVISLNDLNIGDEVSVVAIQNEDGQLRALTVELLSS